MVTAVILACHRRKCGVEGEELGKGSDAFPVEDQGGLASAFASGLVSEGIALAGVYTACYKVR